MSSLEEVRAIPCTCVRCPVCNGTGYRSPAVSADDKIGEFFADPIPCGACLNGVTEPCRRCMELDWLEGIEQYGPEYGPDRESEVAYHAA